MWLYTDTRYTFVESKLDIVVIKIDFVSYYHLHQIVPFLIASHIILWYMFTQIYLLELTGISNALTKLTALGLA